MVEFSDFECPYCERYAVEIAPDLRKEFVSTGHLLYAFANTPLPIHKNAKLLAYSAICAGEIGLGNFWEMHDVIFQEKPRTVAQLVQLGKGLGLNEKEYRACIDAETRPSRRLKDDLELARRLGLRSTPAFALGHFSNGRLAVQKIIIGVQPIDTFEKTINQLLVLDAKPAE